MPTVEFFFSNLTKNQNFQTFSPTFQWVSAHGFNRGLFEWRDINVTPSCQHCYTRNELEPLNKPAIANLKSAILVYLSFFFLNK
jgi:hypothetical protein